MAMAVGEGEAASQHPYHPRTASIPGFVANEWPVTQLMAAFGCAAGAAVAVAYRAAAARCPRPADRFAAAWFALCASSLCAGWLADWLTSG